MPNWNGTLLTAKGRALQAKVEAGAVMTITKLKIGDGTLGSGQNVDVLTDLLAPKKTLGISALTPLESGVCKITAVVTNAGLTAGFYVRELGVFAQDPDLGEILYAYTADGSPDYLPAEGGNVAVAEELVVQLAFSNAASIKATISLDGLITTAILNTHKNTAVIDHPDGSVTDAKVGNRTITDTVTAAEGADTPTRLWSKLGNMVKQITGKASWWVPPAITLDAINALIASTAAAGKLLKLDGNGQLPTGVTGNAATATKLGTARTIAISGKATGTATGFDGSGNIVIPVTAVTADSCTGNAATATKLTTARTISLVGDVAGTGTFDGSNNLSIATTVTTGLPIGFTFSILANTPPVGSLALEGSLVSRAAYPDLWSWIQGNAPLVTESAWQTQAAAQSSVGAYSSGDGSTNFRLPRIVDIVKGSDFSRPPGTWQADALQNITGNIYNVAHGRNVGSTANGAFALFNTGQVGNASDGGGQTESFSFDASRVARTSDETRPKSISMLYCVKAFGAVTNQGAVDITELANTVVGKQDDLKYIEIHDEKASGSSGGTFTSGAWRTRTLNTFSANDGSIATLNTNQIFLQAGTYIVDASAPVMAVDLNQMRLYNITDDVTLLTGTTENSFASLDGNSVITHAFLSGKITLPAPKVLELQHRCSSTCTNYGFGYPSSMGIEVYAVIKFWKVG
jgi:hypothetical protein